MYDFGMKHRAVEMAFLIGDESVWRAFAGGGSGKAFGQLGDAIAMTHPDIEHGMTFTDFRNLLGYDDYQHLLRTDRLLLAKNREFYATFHRHNAFRQNSD